MGMTRFKDARAGYDGPVSGALSILQVSIEAGSATSTAYTAKVPLPAGMKVRVVNMYAYAKTVTATPTITVGSTGSTTALVAGTALTTSKGELTLKSAGQIVGSSTTASDLLVTVTNNTTGVFTEAKFTIHLHVAQPSIALSTRSVNHF